MFVFWGGESRSFRQPAELAEAVAWVGAQGEPRVVMEATGRYERPLFEALTQEGVACTVVNPAHAHAFRRSLGRLAKTDRVDAQVLAQMGESLSLKPTRQLEALVLRRRQLVSMKVANGNHGEHADETTTKSVERVARVLEGEVAELEAQIRELLQTIPELRERNELLQSVPGVGPAVAAGVLVHLPELGRVSKAEIAALAGLAPYNHDSGLHKGKRAIRAGRTPLRSLLYMAALVATKHNPRMRTLYERLLAAGKPKKVALIAVARKLLTILNAMVKHGERWTDAVPA